MKKLTPIILSAALLLSGCGSRGGGMLTNYRETDRLLPVKVLGADAGEMGVRLSVSAPKTAEQSPSGVISREDSSITRALRSLQNYAADQELYYAHTRCLLLGEDYAEESAGEMLDFVARDTQLRLGMGLFAVRGDAGELIGGVGGESYELGKTLEAVERRCKDTGIGHVFTCRETIRSLAETGAALVCAVSPADTTDSVFLGDEGLTAVEAGYGILRDGRLVGWIEPELSQAASLVLGKFGSAGPTLPDGRGGSLSFEYSGGSLKVRPIGDGALRLEAELTASMAETDTDIGRVTDSGLLSKLEDALARDMEDKLRKVLALSKELDADFLGLGVYLQGKPENGPASAKFEVSCTAHIDHTRELADKMNTEGKS